MKNYSTMTMMIRLFVGVLMLTGSLLPAGDKDNREYGVNIHFMWEYREVPKEMEMLDKANIRFVRSDFSWNYQERKAGEWNFERYDVAMKLAAEKNLQVLPILSCAPKWSAPAHKNMAAWLDYVHRNIQRYGKQMDYWEIWNEPNYNVFWANPNPLDYLALLKPTYDLIRKEAPHAKIVMGGTSQIPMSYIETILKNGGGNYFDIMNVHPYNWYEAPEVSLQNQLSDLRKLMDKYKVDKEIWITEIGWPTHKSSYHQEILPQTVQAAGIDPDNMHMAVVNDNETAVLASSPGLDWKRIFPSAKEIRSITFQELKNLDPATCQVLVPCPGEYFPVKYFNDLEKYVRNGGTVIFPRGIPFYTGIERKADGSINRFGIDQGLRKRLHLGYNAWWLDKSKALPHNFTAQLAPKFTGRIGNVKLFGSNAVLSDSELKGNDRMIPVIQGINGNYTGCLMAIYKLDSDLKGTIIVSSINWTGQAAVDEDTQARYLPRTILLALKSGIKKICWYEFQAMENKNDDQEHHFGITHKDLVPKPAFHAYATLAKMRPSGSSTPQITISRQGIYLAKWQKNDGGICWGIWVPGTEANVKIRIQGEIKFVSDYLGKPVDISMAGNSAEIQVSSGITYIDGPQGIVIE